MSGFTASPDSKSYLNVQTEDEIAADIKTKTNTEKEIRKKNGAGDAVVHSKSAPVSRQQTNLDDENEKINCQVLPPVTKAIFTKLETKSKRKKRCKGVFGSVDVLSASTARGNQASQSSSEIGHGLKPKKKKKKKKGKKHKKSKKKKNTDPSILMYLKKNKSDTDDTDDTDDDDDSDDVDEIYPMRKKIYRQHCGIPGQSYLRAELEDPITLVEEEFLPEGIQNLRLTRSQLAMNFMYRKQPKGLKTLEKEPSERSVKLDDTRSKSAQESIISQDLISSARSLAPSVSPNLLRIAPLRPKYNSVRFTIPMDVRVLEKLTPHDYLTNYCKPESYFQNICSRVFENSDKTEFPVLEFLNKSFSEIFGYTIPDAHVQQIIDLIGLDDQIKENFKLFTACAAILMRIQCRELGSNSDKDEIEKMDFYLLQLNLKSFPIDSQTNQLLQFIDSI